MFRTLWKKLRHFHIRNFASILIGYVWDLEEKYANFRPIYMKIFYIES
jgi:hypothetical protein